MCQYNINNVSNVNLLPNESKYCPNLSNVCPINTWNTNNTIMSMSTIQ